MNSIMKSRTLKITAIALASLAFALLVFQAGIIVGYKKASFSRQLGNNFYRAFDGGFPGSLPGGHGSVGFVASLASSSIVVIGPDGIEKVVAVGTTTDIRKFRDPIQVTDLMIGDFVAALGTPGADGIISARAIRVLPPPPELK